MATKATFGATSGPRRRLALVIGINDYENHSKLKNPMNDALKLSSLLRRIGFIIDRSSSTETYNEIRRKLVDFELSIEPNDVVLFYFAGHGVQWEDQNYLIPKDFPALFEINSKDMTIMLGKDILKKEIADVLAKDVLEKDILKKEVADILKEDTLRTKIASILKMNAINAQDTLTRFSNRKPYATIFILDCCREYVLRNPDLNKRSLNASNSKPAGLAAMHKASALVAFACAPGAFVDDRQTDENSLFMKHLLEHIATPNEDIVNIFRDVINGVMADSNDHQIPFLSVQLRHKNIFLCDHARGLQRAEYVRLEIFEMIRPITEAMRNIFRNNLLYKYTSSDKFIELRPKPIQRPSTICYLCQPLIQRYSNIWVTCYSLHEYRNQCEDCSCDSKYHLQVDYQLDYELIDKMNYQRDQLMAWDRELFSASVCFVHFLIHIDHCSNDDPFLVNLNRMINEERHICGSKSYTRLNTELYKELLQLKADYERNMRDMLQKRKHNDLAIINNWIERVKQIPMVRKQLSVAKGIKENSV